MDRLLREGNPPTGQLASPKPQYKKPGVDEYEPVEGQHGAPFATLKDASGNIVSPATEATLEQVRALLSGVATENKLEQARTLLDAISTKDFATSSKQDALNIAVEDLKSELILVKSELEAIKANQLSGDQKVTLSGTVDKLIKEFVDVPINHGTWNFGESVGVSPTPLDISAYTDIVVVIRNTGEQACKLWAVEGFGPSTTKRIFRNTNNDKRWVIPAGASLTLTKRDIPELGDPVPGLTIGFYDNLSTYNTTVSLEVYGRVR